LRQGRQGQGGDRYRQCQHSEKPDARCPGHYSGPCVVHRFAAERYRFFRAGGHT
jgi:hypothetical protein